MAEKQKRTGMKLDHPVVIDALAGGLAGGITAVFVSPLEVLKTRLQTQELKGPDRYQGGFHIYGGLQRIVRSEGVGGLYRGLGPQFMALFPNWAVYFTVYNRLKGTLGKRQSLPQPMVHMLSAVGAGAATSVVTNPLWVAKTRLQTQHMANRPAGRELYRGTMHCMYSIARREGIGALWSGMGASMVGLVHVAVQFPCYEKLKQLLSERRERISHTRELQPVDLILASALSKVGFAACLLGLVHCAVQLPLYQAVRHALWAQRQRQQHPLAMPTTSPLALALQEDQPTYSVTDIVLAASAATAVASTVAYPHELIRSQMHVAGLGPIRGLKEITLRVYREQGIKGLYAGWSVNIVRTIPAAAVTFTSFELISRFLHRWAEQQRQQQPD